MKNIIDLKNKVVLVTGATGGLGQNICLSLAQCGAIPVVHYNSNSQEADNLVEKIKALGINTLSIKADIRIESEVKMLTKTIVEKFGRIDCLVNNAGILLRGFLAMQSLEKYKDAVDINLLGNFLVSKYVTQIMISQKYGSIVNVSSAAGMGGLKGQGVYSSTKGALNSLTVVMAKEMSDFNVRVNAVAPGFIATGMLEKATKQDEKYKEIIPLKRFGEASEVSSVVLFLLSDAASYMTGQVLVIDGGLLIS
ncbi:MAG: 3-oxoacyl-ACP reductase FabG [Chryseobacterium sp.]|uniref:SDR family NAD(P)-dependent oxidoreductase n=1 Tax=Chryseobacterium sp. TaxID=1871047 RepID=UPI0025C244CC|nr:3-oxoacyl-ACP reductase family protein [Chryseobacterium sp.]MCJ7934762.1 3-oxoacyl-ACP reductase FabG [Chryseobacterium sp.]